MKEWRPKNWKTEKIKHNPLHCFAPQECADHFFESGADAILQALYSEVGNKKIWLDKADDGHIIICVEQQ